MINVYLQDSSEMKDVTDSSVQLAVTSYPALKLKLEMPKAVNELSDETRRELLKPNMDVGLCNEFIRNWWRKYYLPSIKEVFRVLTFDGVFFLNVGTPYWASSEKTRHYFRGDSGVLYPYLVAEAMLRYTDFRLRWDYIAKTESMSYTNVSHWFLFSKNFDIKQKDSVLPPIFEGRASRYKISESEDITAFSTSILKMLINKFTEEGDWIIDPFAGTCVLGTVAEDMKRNSILYEKLPAMVEIIENVLFGYDVQYN